MKYFFSFIILSFLFLDFSFAQIETKLPATKMQFFGGYGVDVDMEDDLLISGGGIGFTGAGLPYLQASIFERNGGAWVHNARLVPQDSATNGGGFGMALAISKGMHDYAIVGAWDDGNTNLQSGSVYVFERMNSGPWVQSAKIKAADVQNKASFGLSIAAEGEYFVTGAPNHDLGSGAGSPNQGKVYVFERETTTGSWLQDTSLFASDFVENSEYGNVVGINMPYVIVGAQFGDSVNATQLNGKAYIYERKQTGWEEIEILTPTTRSGLDIFGDSFGASVDIDGDYAVVGATFYVSGNGHLGAAYVFEKTSTGWEEMTILKPDNPLSGGSFGKSVSIKGDVIAVGAPSSDDLGMGGGFENGSVYIFKRSGNQWVQQSPKLIASNATDGGSFGISVAVWGDNAVVGDGTTNSDTVQSSGMTYFYEGICTKGVGVESLFTTKIDPGFIFPNPVGSELFLRAAPENERFSEVAIYDLKGRKIFSQKVLSHPHNVMIPNVPAGIYILSQTFASGISRRQKLVKE